MPKKRFAIPIDTIAELLWRNDHTCCICRKKGKEVQIHHIDNNPSNNRIENLAVLCLEHHARVHQKGIVGKGYTSKEIHLYKNEWEELVARSRKKIRSNLPLKEDLVDDSIRLAKLISNYENIVLNIDIMVSNMRREKINASPIERAEIQTRIDQLVLEKNDYIIHINTLKNSMETKTFEKREIPSGYESLTRDFTGALQKDFLINDFDNVLAEIDKKGTVLSFAMLDIDDFKRINDEFGHLVGDSVLLGLVTILKDFIQDKGDIIRFGGDEFSIFLPKHNLEDTQIIMKEMQKNLATYEFNGLDIKDNPTLSIGICEYPTFSSNKEELIQRADSALYFSKNEKEKNSITTCSEMMKTKDLSERERIIRLIDFYKNELKTLENKLGKITAESVEISGEVEDISKIADFPLLNYWINKRKIEIGSIFKNHKIILLQHIINDFLPLVRSIGILGIKPEDTYIIGTPYSLNKKVVETLQKEGYTNIWIPKSYPFNAILYECIENCLQSISDKEKDKIIYAESGGYITSFLFEKYQKGFEYFKGGIEQSTNGIRKIKSISRSHPLKYPILDLSSCEVKRKVESSFVSDAIVDNLKNILSKYKTNIREKKILVIGYGTIGRQIAFRLKSESAMVYVSDLNPIYLLEAQNSGFIVDSLLNILPECDIVIGSTGSVVLGKDEILSLRNDSVLINASSERKEIDWKELDSLTKDKEEIPEVGTRTTLLNNKEILILANGYPINFYNYESVPSIKIDLIITLLAEAIIQIATKEFPSNIIYLEKEIEYLITETCTLYFCRNNNR